MSHDGRCICHCKNFLLIIVHANIYHYKGDKGKLTVTMKRYDGPRVRCDSSTSRVEPGNTELGTNNACLQVLDYMPADYKFQNYAVAGYSPLDIEIPKLYHVGGKCWTLVL